MTRRPAASVSDVRLRRTDYDTTAAAGVIAASRHPHGAEWAREYVLSHYPDTEALAAFTEIARQQKARSPDRGSREIFAGPVDLGGRRSCRR